LGNLAIESPYGRFVVNPEIPANNGASAGGGVGFRRVRERDVPDLDQLDQAVLADYPAVMPRMVNLYEAKTHLSSLVEAVERGEEIIIAKNGVPKARLAPIGPRKRARKPSGLMRIIHIANDFDAPDSEIEHLFEDGA
jgi:prevent-host-death family protein